ncbi:S-layer homology domain-containing protein [Paenibacillus sp. 19GGS1-52]|uniref:YcdB/YcdC domain-containing protein n=1 Tax=Paenibacillus sp. 19GGS1-52 TaxID=2758563 RepID=UPI001EFC1125|nr:YcdB/YcdC domain-containing protein [Paenibacillus sp. 19GGS1-52]ULO08582.1 S-layer homology domain-containing protein [Paenibacillus sp. 19GGS1-52]
MKSNSTHHIHQTTRAALITSVALALLLPAGLAGASSSTATSAATFVSSTTSSAQTTATTDKADPTKVKITKEEAIAKVKELFPALKEATASSVELGSSTSYPPLPNQMAWTIQWQYRVGNSTYGFSSTVDANNGDLINTYISMPLQENASYYPPELSQAQALKKVEAFIVKAVPSIKSSDLQLDETSLYNINNAALFGPVQYNFIYKLLKNGIPSAAEGLQVTIDGSGNVLQFYKMTNGFNYPAAKPTMTQAEADKKFTDSFEVALYYIPIYKNGMMNNWIMGWRPVEQALYSVDAVTGKRIDNEGADSTSPMTYADVPQSKKVFRLRSTSTELSAEEAAKLVEQVAFIPAGRKLLSKSLSDDYQTPGRKIWRLTWSEGNNFYGGTAQSTAEVDALTGQILTFQAEQLNYPEVTKAQAAPTGGKKITQAEAKLKSLELVNLLYDKASSELKLVQYGGDWNVVPGGTGYRYQFIRYYKGIPVSDGNVNITLDLYGRLQDYSIYRNTGLEKIAQVPADATVTKQEALAIYKSQYKMQLQYTQIGGFTMNNTYATPSVKLTYTPVLMDSGKSLEVLDAVTGKWVSYYPIIALQGTPITATDLKGHWAEKELSELVKYNVLTPEADGKVNPEQEITVGDWLTMIAKATTPNYTSYYNGNERKAVAGVNLENPYYEAVNFAAEHGWISKDVVLQTESKLTREQLAVQLTSFLKYNKISAFMDKDATVSQFSDNASIINKGAVAVAVKLGLLQADNGKFNPQQIVTKALAASVIMKLVELQGKTDQTIGQ